MGAHGSEKGSNPIEFDCFIRVRDDMKCEIASDGTRLLVKLPSLDVGRDEIGGGEEVKTPTALDRRIPAVIKCPPAPRKQKSSPLGKRKEDYRRLILLDLTKEIDSLFPPAVRADLGNKIRSFRQGKCELKS